MTARRSLQLLGATLLVMAVNVGISYLWVAFYSLLIEPGHDAGYYQAYARVAAPYTSIVAGIPLVYLAGRWVARWGQREAPMRNAMALWAIYLGLDLAVMVGAGSLLSLAPLVVASFATKGIAAWAAGRTESRSMG
jgi:hypothetical protein